MRRKSQIAEPRFVEPGRGVASPTALSFIEPPIAGQPCFAAEQLAAMIVGDFGRLKWPIPDPHLVNRAFKESFRAGIPPDRHGIAGRVKSDRGNYRRRLAVLVEQDAIVRLVEYAGDVLPC